MMDEMQAVGLPEPVFYRNNFMLQIIVKNKSSYSNSNDDSLTKKVAIEEEKVTIGAKKVAIDEEKVAIESVRRKCIHFGLSQIMTESILEILNYVEPN